MRYIFVLLALLLGVASVAAQDATPDPDNLSDYIDESRELMDTARDLQNDPAAITDGAQLYDDDGSPLLPDTEFLEVAVGYGKFVFDATYTAKVFGPFSPIVNHVRIFLLLTLAWFAFYFAQQIVVNTIRFALFLVRYLVPWLG